MSEREINATTASPYTHAQSSADPSDDIVPTIHARHQRGRNLIWCAALDIAWLEACAALGGPVELLDSGGEDPAALLVRALNQSPVTRNVIDSDACVTLAGLDTLDLVQRIDRELSSRFGAAADARLFDRVPHPDLLVAYAYMAKSWVFPAPLMRSFSGIKFRCEAQVETFGLWQREGVSREITEKRLQEVLVHYFQHLTEDAIKENFDREPEDDDPVDEFVVEIRTNDVLDRLVIAECVPRTTLAATVQWAIEKLRDDVDADPRARLELDRLERFEVPCIDFDLERAYGELRYKKIKNEGFEAQSLGDVVERIKFSLNEGGARLSAEARIGGLSSPPRLMVCNVPFLVMVLRQGETVPCLAIWVANPSLLVGRQE